LVEPRSSFSASIFAVTIEAISSEALAMDFDSKSIWACPSAPTEF
jgi:hypothetical protein